MVYDAYNLSLINGTGLQPLIQTVNDNLMFGYFGVLVLLTIGVILFLSMMAFSNNFKKSIGLTSLVCAIISVMFRMLSFVSDDVVIIAWVIAAIVIMLTFFIPE